MNTLIVESSREEQVGLSATARTVLFVGIAWFLVVTAMALTNSFDAAVGERPLLILFAVTAPVLIFSLSYLGITAFRQWVLALDMRHLILLHSWRMVGMGFVFLYFHDRLPALFALPAGLGDAMAAVGAIFLGIAMYESPESVSRRRILAWNTFGLADFVIAVSLGVMTRTDEVLHISGSVGSETMGVFPLALIPAFAVPFYVITHLVIFAQLKQEP